MTGHSKAPGAGPALRFLPADSFEYMECETLFEDSHNLSELLTSEVDHHQHLALRSGPITIDGTILQPKQPSWNSITFHPWTPRRASSTRRRCLITLLQLRELRRLPETPYPSASSSAYTSVNSYDTSGNIRPRPRKRPVYHSFNAGFDLCLPIRSNLAQRRAWGSRSLVMKTSLLVQEYQAHQWAYGRNSKRGLAPEPERLFRGC